MKVLRTAATTLLLGAAVVGPGLAQQASRPFELTVPNIMRGPEHVGEAPSSVRWTDDGRWIVFRWKQGGLPWYEAPSLYRVSAGGGEPEKLSDEAADSLGVLLAPGTLSPDERTRAVSYRGDLYLIERRSMKVRQLTDTREFESSPVFSRDGRTLYFLRDDNLYALSLDGGALRQLTDVRVGSEPREKTAEGQRKFLEEQQKELFEHIRVGIEKREREKALREAREAREPKTIWIPQGERVMGLAVEPSGRYAILQVGKPARDARQTMVPDWVTESGYTEPLNVRSKVGDAQSEARLALVVLETGEATWLDLWPEADEDEEKGQYDGRFAQIRFIGWNEQGTKGLITAISYDFKNRWLQVIDAASGEVTVVDHDYDEAWIGGPCDWGCIGWLPGGERIYFTSERDGYNHVYTVRADGSDLRQLTRGEWEVTSVEVMPDRKRFLLHTSEGSPFEQHVYHMNFDGSRRTRVTSQAGQHQATVSPDGRKLAVVHSYSNRPPELFVMDNKPGASMRQLTDTPTEEWKSFAWIDPEIIHFPARDGVMVPARIYRPADLGARPNGAAVIFVHGAGYLQNVHKGWSSYYREYMFHHLLAARGYTVLDIDYRGSAGYGRDWRTAIYRHMGGKDLTDQIDGARWLVENEGIESFERIGIYGGSYGGFITLMALFTAPESFGAGAALRAVTDWAHYNHWYTSRILNLPQDDEEAYRRSSPIYFAEGLEDPLLIAHGMVDTNVHFSDVVRLAQRLIELGKTDWEMAVYPVEDHGFVEPSSWTDEYRRILELFDRHLSRPIVTSDAP